MRGFMILGGDGFVGLVILSSKFILSTEYKPHNYTIDDGAWPSVKKPSGFLQDQRPGLSRVEVGSRLIYKVSKTVTRHQADLRKASKNVRDDDKL